MASLTSLGTVSGGVSRQGRVVHLGERDCDVRKSKQRALNSKLLLAFA